MPAATLLALALLLPAPGAASPAPVATPQQHPEDGRGQGLFDAAWHAARRQELARRVGEGVLVLRGAPTQDDYREFRQDNNFWYLTGLTTPNATLILVPKEKKEYLFVPPANPRAETWVGDLVDPEEAKDITGIERCHPNNQLDKALRDLAKRYRVFYIQLAPAENWMMSRDNLQDAARTMHRDPWDERPTREERFQEKLQERLGVEVRDLTAFLDGMRQVKTPEEIAAMRRACRISGAAHELVIRTTRPGTWEWQIAAAMTGEMLRQGAMGPAYMAIVASGPNANTMHYTANNRQVEEGDLVLIDYAGEYNHYCADVTRTWPVAGGFSPRQRKVYEAVLAAQEAALRECKPGSTLLKVEAAARRELARRGLGRALLHGVSHWIGMSTHDVGAYRAKLEPGMVFTVEPGAYLPDEGFGIRIEDVVAITEDGHEVLSAGIPKTVEEIEALRRAALHPAGD